MIQGFVTNVATQMGIEFSHFSVIDGKNVGCLNVHLLRFSAGGKHGSALVYQTDLDDLHSNFSCDRLELKIRNALSALQ